MAIHPIDLQVMYSQMSNVAKIAAHQQGGAQLAESLQQNKIIQQNAEQAESVQKAAEDEAKLLEVKADGGRNGSGSPENRENEKKKSVDSETKKETEFRETYLGQHIDITR
jgi:membrane protease subunit (stomatin/prohibitin family)